MICTGVVRYHVCQVVWLQMTKLWPCLSCSPGFFGHFSKMNMTQHDVFSQFFKGTIIKLQFF